MYHPSTDALVWVSR